MNLKYIVPALGFVALGATAQAADTAGVTVGGFVDTGFNILSNDVGVPSYDTYNGTSDEMTLDFWAETELQVAATIGQDVSLQVDLEVEEDGTTDLEQANIAYTVDPKVTLVMGRFETFLGWEAVDAPGLYRVNYSPVAELSSDSMTGIDAGIMINEKMSLDIILTDDIWGDTGAGVGTTTSDALAIGLNFGMDVDNYGNVDIEFAWDQYAGVATTGDADRIQFGINTTATDLVEGWLFGAEFSYADVDAYAMYGLLLAANYKVNEKVSATGMFSYYEPNDDADDNEDMEIAVALLTTPTGDDNFALNAEIGYLMAGADDSDAFILSLEALAVIP